MKNSSIHDNSAKSWVIASNQFTLANTEITDNNSTTTADPKWAGVYADAATITSSKISNNGGNGLRTGNATITDTEVLGNDGVNYTVSAGKVATISNSDIDSISLWNSTNSSNVTTRALIDYKETDEAGKVFSFNESPLTSGQFTVATADKESQLDRYDSFASDDDSVFVQLMDTGVEATRYSLMLIESYTVNYDANGAEGAMESQVIDSAPAKDATLTELAFTNEGLVFMGWNTKADGTGLSYTDKELLRNIAITADAEITLYAQWENLCEEGHTVATDEAVPATCTATGLTEGSHCSVCGIIITAQEATEIIDHSFTDYVSNNDATCTEDGTKTAKCDNCDAEDTVEDEGSATGHSFTDYVSNNDATCTEDGTKTAKCDNCDATDTVADEGSATGHSFTDYVSNGDATCSADGTKTAKCDNCDATDTVADEGTATGHSFTDYVSNGDATCTEDGTKTAKCDKCDATDTVADEGTATGHSFTDYVSNGDATCTEDGTKTAKCDYCDAEDSYIDDDSATGHDYVEQADGSQVCSVCGDVIEAPENNCRICALKANAKNILWVYIYSILDMFFHNFDFIVC